MESTPQNKPEKKDRTKITTRGLLRSLDFTLRAIGLGLYLKEF